MLYGHAHIDMPTSLCEGYTDTMQLCCKSHVLARCRLMKIDGISSINENIKVKLLFPPNFSPRAKVTP